MAPENISFISSGTTCRGWLHLPDTPGPHPVVVLSHGYGFQHLSHYWRSAEAFAALGIAVLDFDCRHLGASDGNPRDLVDMGRQVEDLRAAVSWVRTRPEVDPGRVLLYGSSAGGGVAAEVASTDPRLAGLLLVVPHVDGLTNLPGVSVLTRLKLMRVALQDRIGRARGREPIRIRIAGEPGDSEALIDRDDAVLALREEMMPGGVWTVPDEVYVLGDLEFHNLCTAWEVLGFVVYRPGPFLKKFAGPICAVLATDDTVTPPGPQRKALRAAGAEIHEVPGGHFSPFLASQHFDEAFAVMADWLREQGFVTDRHSEAPTSV